MKGADMSMTAAKGMRRAAPVVLVALMAALIPAATAAAESPACRKENGETLRITATPERTRYRIGDTARIEVFVERDLAATVMPAEEVDVSVSIDAGGRLVAARGRTNEAGLVRISVPLEEHLRPGTADVGVLAHKEHISAPCLPVREHGYRLLEGALRIRN